MTRRTINWTVLALSLVAAIGVAGGAYALHSWQLGRLSKALLVVSQAREAEEKWQEAAIYLDRYLRVHPTDASVRGRLATLYAKGAGSPDEMARAVELYYRALAAGPGDAIAAGLRAELARLQFERGRFVEAEQEARKVVELQPDHPEANRALSLSLFAQWENGALATAKLGELKLVATAQKACHLNPADELLAEVAAAFYRDHASVVAAESPGLSEADRQQLADDCLDELVSRNPQNPQAYLARYRYRARYELPGAADDVAQALQLAPSDSNVVLTAAKAAQREALLAQEAKRPTEDVQAKFEQARKLFEQLVQEKSKPVAPDAFLGLGNTHQGLGKLDQAIAAWRTGLKRFTPPTIQIEFLSRIADGLLAAERADEAKDTLDAIKDLVGSLDSSVSRNERLALNQAQDLRRASWHLQRGEAAAAIPLLQDVVSRQASGTSGNATAAVAWNLIGRANALLGEWGEAAVAFDRAAPLNPKSHATRLAAAYAWFQTGRPDLAVERADQSLSIQPTVEAMIVLATAELERQMSLPAKERTWDRLDRVLAGLEKDRTALAQIVSPWRVDFLRADYALLRSRQEGEEVRGRNEAIAAIERAELDHDQSAEFWQLAALAYQRLSDDASAERAFGRYRELKTSVADQAIVQARLARARKDLDLAQRTLEEVGSRASVSEQSRLRGELIDVALAKRDLPLAERLLAAEAQQRPKDISLLRRGCELAMERGDLESVARWEQKLAEAGTLGNWWASYFHALRLLTSAKSADVAQLQQALEVQSKLSDIRPHWPMPVALRGMIELRLGRLEQAAESLERAIQLGERRVTVFEQLIGLLDQLNRPADAERYLSRLESYMPFSQRLTEFASNQELRRDNPEQAIEIAKNAALKRPADPFAHLWLARLLLASKDHTAAEAEFKRALELAPKDVRAWNGLFTFYVRTGAMDEARRTLEELRVKAELSAADRSYVMAQGYEMLGDWDSATKQYEDATGAAPDKAMIHVRLAAVHLRSDPQKAEASLRQALQVEPESAVARRMLAALLAARGDVAKLREAESLLNRTDPAAAGIAVEDRRLNALLLAQYGDAAQAGKAAQILEDVVAKPEGSLPGDRLVLSQIYENQARGSQDPKAAETKRKQAHEHLLAVASRADAEPGQVATLIEFLLRRNQAEEARTWLDKLETLIDGRAKDDPAAIAQLIELRIRQGSADRCPAWLDRLAAADSDPLRPVAMRAKWLASQQRGTEAEPLLEPVATKLVADAKDNRERGRLSRLIGDLYFAVELRPQAERWFRAAATHDPVQFPSLALALARDKKVAEVVRLCQGHAQRDTTSRPATVLASVLTEAGSAPEHNAEIDGFLAAALKQHAADKQLLYTVATLRAYQSRYDEAVTLYRELLKQDPKNIPTLNNLAMMLAELPDRRAESIALIDKAISIAGQQPGLLDTKGAILVYHGQARQAVSLLEAATREAGDDPRHRFHLAAAYHEVGESAKAREQLQAALDQNLDQQVLTPTDRRLLGDLKAALLPQTTSVLR